MIVMVVVLARLDLGRWSLHFVVHIYGGLIDAVLKVYKRNEKRFMRSDDRDNT